jgi:transcriptional antiterminator RfaH
MNVLSREEDIPCWYAIHTNPKQEERAASNLRAWGLETFNPKIKERRCNEFTGAPTYTTKPLFPRYIFSRFNASTLLHKVWFTRGVHRVVSFNDGPVAIDDEIISFIQQQIDEQGLMRPQDEFRLGDKVMIQDGPLKSLVGIFDQAVKGTDRVMILLSAVSYQGSVTIEKERLKKVS